MGDIHELVIKHGREAARAMVRPEDRPLVDIAAEILADERQNLGITYSGFCLTSLPHKKLADDAPWEKRGHQVTLLVEPGRLKVNGKTKLFGVPYGARARMILIYLQTQAIRTGRREVELGRSMRDWLTRMGISVGGETFKGFREQSLRISACSLKFFWDGAEADAFEKGGIVKRGLIFHDSAGDDRQGSLWEDVVQLDETFFQALQDHPVPLLEEAVRQLKDRSLSLDLYVWLAYRLHSLQKPQPITWASLYAQFGAGYDQMKHFKPRFVQAMQFALAAYPGAKVENADEGMVLHPSRPPVARLTA
ncbi:replication protein RepA [Azospirillum brasilense]|uniref:replication protein RepA n=1 Tax=Azospirillum brasilense TaxID=192 RepID=UPI000E09E8F8|nr:replication protein RepA [Azospirillum brasilense]